VRPGFVGLKDGHDFIILICNHLMFNGKIVGKLLENHTTKRIAFALVDGLSTASELAVVVSFRPTTVYSMSL
jgi:hypothetical protein